MFVSLVLYAALANAGQPPSPLDRVLPRQPVTDPATLRPDLIRRLARGIRLSEDHIERTERMLRLAPEIYTPDEVASLRDGIARLRATVTGLKERKRALEEEEKAESLARSLPLAPMPRAKRTD
jgi:hypothetical protein